MQPGSFAHRRLDPQAYRRSPWKNGGGVTVDIAAAYADGASAGDWSALVWRFGRTRIEEPGPFSDLAGFDRTLSVIAGRGLVLLPSGAAPIDVREPFRPVRFPGEWRIESALEAGGVGVLNLMTDRRLVQGELAFLRRGEARRVEARTLIFYAPSGDAAFHLGDERLVLAEDDAIRLDGQGAVPIRHEHGVLAIARIGAGA